MILKHILKKPKRLILKIKNAKNPFAFLLNLLLSSRTIILLMIIIFYLKTLFFYNNIDVEVDGENPTLLLTIIFILIILTPCLLIKKNKNRFYVALWTDILISLLLFADNAYWNYSSGMLSVSQILYVKYAEEISGALPYLLELKSFLYLIDIPIFLVLWHFASIDMKNKKSKVVKNKGKRRLIFALVYLLCIILLAKDKMAWALNTMNENPYVKQIQVSIGSIYGYHILDVYNSVNVKKNSKYKTYKQMMDEYSKIDTYSKENFSDDESFTGIAKNKNVIILQLESVQEFVLHKKINGKEITPNLNKFLDENIEITNMMSQSYTTTADSEYSVLTSLYPLENGIAFSRYSSSINNDLFKAYKDNRIYDSLYAWK